MSGPSPSKFFFTIVSSNLIIDPGFWSRFPPLVNTPSPCSIAPKPPRPPPPQQLSLHMMIPGHHWLRAKSFCINSSFYPTQAVSWTQKNVSVNYISQELNICAINSHSPLNEKCTMWNEHSNEGLITLQKQSYGGLHTPFMHKCVVDHSNIFPNLYPFSWIDIAPPGGTWYTH